MGPSTRNLNQDVTYWAPGDPNSVGDYGYKNFAAPVKLVGRWETKTQLAKNTAGEEFVSNATVFLPSDIIIGGYLAEGDQTAFADPGTYDGAWEIKQFIKTPDLRRIETERRALL